MKYRTNRINGDSICALGFGCMRFPRDYKESERLILHAIEEGINYFDTAYIYPNSEATLGKILKENDKRADVKIATKIMPTLIKKRDDLDKYFQKQLDRLQTDYIDYYFIHMITDVAVWERLIGLGIIEWIGDKKRDGKIKNIGFSYHGGRDEFIKIVDTYSWEFCMIYYNYLDEFNQAGRHGLEYAASKDIPVMIMGPLKGGILSNKLPKAALEVFEKAYVKRTPTDWALRWILNHPGVTCVLSGMSDMAMLKENLDTAEDMDANSFSDVDHLVINDVRRSLSSIIKVSCTGCNYCMPCPRGVDIPTCLTCYNDIAISGKMSALQKYATQTAFKAKPQIASQCNKCGKCEKDCPQSIKIGDELENAARALEKFWFRPMMWVARRIMRL